MAHRVPRRRFLQTSAAIGAGYWVAGGVQAKESKSALEKIRFGAIGVDGKGSSDSGDAGNSGEMVAICDVDEERLGKAGDRFKGAKRFTDYRKMLESMAKEIDAVTVSTPDHVHAPASMMAMSLGMHCFCQKPMTHTIYEARKMGEIAREKKLATQMGNQGTAMPGLRKAAAMIQAGVIGDVTEVHVWTNRPIWPQGGKRPKAAQAGPPKSLNWDLWLGPAPERDYADSYHPFKWRGWWDFGTGALGDMACHTVNMPFMGLDLRDPISVQATTSGHNGDSYPAWSVIDFEFGATEKRKGLKFRWYDGGKRVSADLLDGHERAKKASSGALLVGTKGKIFSPDDYGAEYFLIGVTDTPKVEIEASPGHFQEWVRAIKGGPQARSNFPDYSGPLTETILLGNLAVWAAKEEDVPGKKIEWDAKNLVAKNAPEVGHIIKKEYRKGYSI